MELPLAVAHTLQRRTFVEFRLHALSNAGWWKPVSLSADRSRVVGPFTAADNEDHGSYGRQSCLEMRS